MRTNNKLPKGFSLQITGGKYAKFYASFTRMSWRICLGWIAVTLFFFDAEVAITDVLIKSNKEKNRENC